MIKETISQIGDNIYVNISFYDNISLPTPRIMEYRVTKTIPIINKCDDYYLSVIRFDIPLTSIPLYIFPIVPNSGMTNITPMKIGIRYLGINYTFNLIYIPDNNYIQPNQNNPNKQIITPYYFSYNYNDLINSLNIALSQAYVASGLNLLGYDYPYFFLDYNTSLIKLVVDQRDFAPTATPTIPLPIPLATIYINENLQFYLNSFSYKYIGDTTNGREYELYLINFGNYNLQNTSSSFSNQQKIFSQEYINLGNWGGMKKLLITTTSIPVISEYLPTDNSGISSTFPIIADFTPIIELAGQSRSIAYYNPTSQYRLVDLKSSIMLNTIDIKVYWTDIYNDIYPLTLNIYDQANIKIAFIKKSLYKYNYLTK